MPENLITEEVLALIGQETEPERNRFPISDEMAWDVADAIQDPNRLYTDPEYAGQSRFGGLLCPPLGDLEGHRADHRLLRRRAGVPLSSAAALQQLRPQRGQRLAVPPPGLYG